MPVNSSEQASAGIVYKTATYTAVNGDFVVCTSGTFTVNLPALAGAAYGVPTSAGAGAVPYQPGNVRVRNNGSGTVTVKTTDSTTIDGIAGATGAVLAQYRGVALVNDSLGNWVSQEGVHT